MSVKLAVGACVLYVGACVLAVGACVLAVPYSTFCLAFAGRLVVEEYLQDTR